MRSNVFIVAALALAMTLAVGARQGQSGQSAGREVSYSGCVGPAGNADYYALTGGTISTVNKRPRGESADRPIAVALRSDRLALADHVGQRVTVRGREISVPGKAPTSTQVQLLAQAGARDYALNSLTVESLEIGTPTCCPEPKADCVDRWAATFVRDRVMEIFAREGTSFEKSTAERYWREGDADRKAQMYAAALGARMLQDMNLLPDRGQRGGVGFWKTLGLVLASQFAPVDTIEMIARLKPGGGGGNPFAFNPEESDTRAKIAHEAARVLVRKFLSPDTAEAYGSATPLAQTQYLVTALQRLLHAQRWPTGGALFLTDAGIVDVSAPLAHPVRGSYAKMLIGVLLGTDSPEYRTWDEDRGERRRAATLFSALDSLFVRAESVVADTPRLTTQAFKDQVQFKRWVYNADEDERTVAEAFGKAGLQRFRALSAPAGRAGTDGLAELSGSRELSDLYRAAVVRAVVWQWALYLSF